MNLTHNYTSSPSSERTVCDVRVSCNPAYVCCTEEYLRRMIIKHISIRQMVTRESIHVFNGRT